MGGLANVNAETTDITEINLTGNYQYGTVPAGILPSFNPGTTTEGASIGTGNGGWAKRTSATSMWGGFAADTPVAYNDGSTEYGFTFYVKTNSGYQLASAFKVFYNGEEVTSTVEVLKYAWGAYVTVDLGKAIGENPTTHTVTFNSNGGTEIPPKEVVSGLKIPKPSEPTKDKYLFRGWYEDATFSTKFDFYNTPITSDMTLYAKWEAANSINEIRLAGDIQYGTVSVGTLPSFNPGTTTDSITIDNTNSYWAKRTSTTSLWGGFAGNTPVAYNDGKTYYGYTFRVVPNDGYQLDYSNLKVFYNEAEVTSTAEVSTRYSWGAYVTVDLGKANGTPVVYTITFNSNGGTEVASKNVNAGEKLTEPTPAPTKAGFTFDGWYEDSTFSKKFDFNTPITGNITLYAKWVENKYTLTFDANGGSGSMAPKADLTGEYILPSNEFTAPSGKQFKGWSLTADGAIVTKVEMTENKTVYAIWEDMYSYRFLEGTGEQTIDGKAKSFKLVIDADENKFVSLEIDRALYQKNIYYTVRHGSTIIDFTSAGLAKLNTLSKGDYYLTLTFTDEVINGKLHVTAANPTVTPQKPNTDNPKPNTDSPKSNTDNVKNNPKTYDGTCSYIEILLVVILCLISVVIIGKKRSRNY